MDAAPIDLDAYFARIGYAGPTTPSLETLRAIHLLHPARIPFENLDILLGRGVRIDPTSIERKLVAGLRGGYCYEQNGLLRRVLVALGFSVTGLSARVLWQVPAGTMTPRTHMLLKVDVDGGSYLVDVGFGGLVLTGPLDLSDRGPQATPHEPHRIVHDGSRRRVQANLAPDSTESEWVDLYQFCLEASPDVDYELANWYTSTHPHSRFVQNLIVSRVAGDTRLVLRNRELVVRRRGGEVERREVASAGALLTALERNFGLIFPPETRFGAPGAAWATG